MSALSFPLAAVTGRDGRGGGRSGVMREVGGAEECGANLSGLVGAREKRTAPQNMPGDWSEWVVSGVKAFPGASGFAGLGDSCNTPRYP